MIRHLYSLLSHAGALARFAVLQVVLGVLQGLLLGLLVPLFRALMRPEPDFAAAAPWLWLGGAGLLAYGVLAVITTPIGFAASMGVAGQLRLRLIRHVATLPLGWFGTRQKARLARAVTADAGAVGQLAVTIGGPAITSAVVPITIVGVSFAVDWRMALLFALILPLAWLALRHAGNVASVAERNLDAAATEVAGRAIEFGQAQSVLRAAGRGSTGTERMRTALDDHRRVYRQGLRRSQVPDLSYTAVVLGGFVVVLIAGVLLLLDGQLIVPDVVAVLVLAVRFLEPLGAQIELIGALRAMDNATGRVQSIMDTPALPAAAEPVSALADTAVEFDDVGFDYPDGTPALSGVSFRCPPGSVTALVGPSGAGKTTVIRLIARFFDTSSGAVRVGGTDVRDFDHSALLDQITIVFQDVYLFDMTIEENLRLALPDATDAELHAAARAARLDEVVDRLPAGWQTRVGEGGLQLSGGERQRVSIARAFLKNSPIVLIDEAASALDPENERAISTAIANLAADPRRTVLVIAHRPATLAAASQVVALTDGRVAETGTPEQLRHTGGVFARLAEQYEHARSWHLAAATETRA
nr:ABC transporter ATP-binding protein [Kibdelosporangium sp. MJ126-NF4]CEL19863.1 Putative ABC iron siderophore transporter, fused permease and ATPase domains [Kibdelosporangium sp. MJ126-NF4]CTQ97087.1 Putative ABC iron siderophore transporter, fused permease and ATPase domains [Kibdelosporangium sp. MJ126-NF4]